jgi:predicted kinase
METSSAAVPQETADQAQEREEAASLAIVEATEKDIASRQILADIATEEDARSG